MKFVLAKRLLIFFLTGILICAVLCNVAYATGAANVVKDPVYLQMPGSWTSPGYSKFGIRNIQWSASLEELEEALTDYTFQVENSDESRMLIEISNPPAFYSMTCTKMIFELRDDMLLSVTIFFPDDTQVDTLEKVLTENWNEPVEAYTWKGPESIGILRAEDDTTISVEITAREPGKKATFFYYPVPVFSMPPVLFTEDPNMPHFIENGFIKEQIVNTEDLSAPFKITAPFSKSCYLYLKNQKDESKDCSIFVNNGTTFETDICLGDYDVYYAIGDMWYNQEKKFGISTYYYRLEDTFHFYLDGNILRGYELSLEKMSGGNLQDYPMSSEDFPE